MQRAFAAHGIESVQRFSAIDGNEVSLPRDWIHSAARTVVCSVTSCALCASARDAGAPSVLIFEDDAVFDPHFQRQVRNASFNEVPDDWDMLYFRCASQGRASEVSEHVGRITKANSTYAYALTNTVFDAFIELNAGPNMSST